MEHGDDLEVATFRARPTDLLDRSEQSFLEHVSDPQPRVVTRMRRGRGYRWLPARTESANVEDRLPTEFWTRFVEARARALARLSALGGSNLARLAEMQEEIESYAAAYRQLLSALFQGEERVDREARALVCLFDCLLVSRDTTTVDEDDEPPILDLPEDVVGGPGFSDSSTPARVATSA